MEIFIFLYNNTHIIHKADKKKSKLYINMFSFLETKKSKTHAQNREIQNVGLEQTPILYLRKLESVNYIIYRDRKIGTCDQMKK